MLALLAGLRLCPFRGVARRSVFHGEDRVPSRLGDPHGQLPIHSDRACTYSVRKPRLYMKKNVSEWSRHLPSVPAFCVSPVTTR